jgi:hypothetical protein
MVCAFGLQLQGPNPKGQRNGEKFTFYIQMNSHRKIKGRLMKIFSPGKSPDDKKKYS